MSGTRTGTNTITVTGGDVRKVLGWAVTTIKAVCKAAKHASKDFDEDAASEDLGLFVMYEIIEGFHLQIYHSGTLVREYSFDIAAEPVETWGPAADSPPLGYVPEGAHIRLVVTPNRQANREQVTEWFRRRNWTDAAPLNRPKGTHQTYGAFGSGGFGLHRRLLSNPDFDKPMDLKGLSSYKKGR